MLCGRCSGSFSRHRRTKDSTTSGTTVPGERTAIGFTAWLVCARMVSRFVCPSKGTNPERHS